MSFYECVFLARQDISNTQVEALIETFAGVLAAEGGQVTKREYWGLKNLTYRVKKNRKAHFALMNLDAQPAAVQEMERTMRLNEDVLRFLTIRVEALEEGPSIAMQNRGNRDERPRRGFGDKGGFGDRGGYGERGGFGDERPERADRHAAMPVE